MNIEGTIVRTLVSIIPIISAVYIIVGLKLYRQKGPRQVNFFSWLMFASAVYSFGYYLELNWISEATFSLIRDLEFLGVIFIPSFGILFINQLTNNEPSRRTKTLLITISTLLWLLFITNPLHHLVYDKVDLLIVKGFSIAFTKKKPLFYTIMAHYAVFVTISSITLIRAYGKVSRQSFKASYRFLLMTFQIAWIPVIIILLGQDKYFDPVPATILIINSLFVVNEIKNDMF
jgi:hypothetical protein